MCMTQCASIGARVFECIWLMASDGSKLMAFTDFRHIRSERANFLRVDMPSKIKSVASWRASRFSIMPIALPFLCNEMLVSLDLFTLNPHLL